MTTVRDGREISSSQGFGLRGSPRGFTMDLGVHEDVVKHFRNIDRLERWLSRNEQFMLLKRTRVQFITVCNSSSWGISCLLPSTFFKSKNKHTLKQEKI